jgi:hypothetical protein
VEILGTNHQNRERTGTWDMMGHGLEMGWGPNTPEAGKLFPPRVRLEKRSRKRALFGGQGSNRAVEFQGKGEGVGVASCGLVDARPIYHFVTCCAPRAYHSNLAA